MSIAIIIIVIVVVLFGFTLASYPVLKRLGVKDALVKRSFVFGGLLCLIQTTSSIAFAALGAQLIGFIIGLGGSFLYVKSVLKVSTIKNLGIILFLPFVATLIAAPILLIFFKSV